MQTKPALNSLRFGLSAVLLAAGAAASPAWSHDHHAIAHGQELGTSAAFDPQGRLWIARTEAAKETHAPSQPASSFVVLQVSSDMGKTWSAPARVQQAPEAIEATGESRPKLAFGSKGQMYITYTHPLGKPYTGEIRFASSLDGGRTFSAPVTVHRNRDLITHRFDSLIVDGTGRVYVAWIDKRDGEAARARKEPYAGAAVYYAVSEDGGAHFKGDYKLADHSCECCRIALALDPGGQPVALWRAVFDANVRDHAIARLSADGVAPRLERATFDNWHIDACPHHGPSLAFAADGTRHQVWFDLAGDEGGLFYASATPGGRLGKPVRLGSDQAEHGEVAVNANKVAIAWKQFDGQATAIMLKASNDGGKTWREQRLASTEGNSDHPHLVTSPAGIILVWRTQNEGVRIIPAI
jgi:hypothetical protein